MSKVAIEHRPGGLGGNFLDTLAATAGAMGLQVRRVPTSGSAGPDEIAVLWNGKLFHPSGPTLYCEHGWLPRGEFQVSPTGVNADSHLAPFVWDGSPLPRAAADEVERRLEAIRTADHAACAEMRTMEPPVDDLPTDFLLVPLQMEWDTNVERHVPPRFRRMQGLIDGVTEARPPWPVVFKQHPSDVPGGSAQLQLRPGRPQDVVRPHATGNVHQLLKSGRCRGIVSLNSNVVHDGLLWDVPAVVLGSNVWPRTGPGPFLTELPADWETLAGHLDRAEVRACRQVYAWYLMRNQWTMDDVRDPARVEQLLAMAGPAPAEGPAPSVTPRWPRSLESRI